MGWGWDYRPYVPVAKRRANALCEVQRLAKKGRQVSPVEIAGRMIASTFWGKAWCDNLESYSDFSNRLPRGRTYVRNGSVVDLQIEPGKVTSLVSGSSLYRVASQIRPLAAPAEIEMSCSCPDWAGMCKHFAATLYGVGSRLDSNPELLFNLRQVDHLDLIAQADRPVAKLKAAGRKTITNDQLADVFGIELETGGETPNSASVQRARRNSHEKTRSEKTLVSKSRGADRAGTVKEPEKTTQISTRSAGPKRKMLTAKERKRIAEAQRKRWEAVRQRLLSKSGDGNLRSPAPAGKTAKEPSAQSIRGKSTGRVRAL